MVKKIRKAVFPVAGLGTRFLPATKATPKEMLPIVDKPLIQYAVEEAIEAGVETIIFIIGRNKGAIVDHFDKAYELETELEKRSQQERLNQVQSIIPSHINCVYVRQMDALGLGHAVLCAKNVVGNEPFAVLLADDLIDGGEKGVLKQMCELYEKEQQSIIGVEIIPHEDTNKYGIVDIESYSTELSRLKGIVEKPDVDKAPTNLAVVGRYILTPRVFELLETIPKGSGGEYQLTDAIAHLLQEENVYSYAFSGRRYDCGSKLGFLQATVDYALKDRELGPIFNQWLQARL